jgi:hypothetical protein
MLGNGSSSRFRFPFAASIAAGLTSDATVEVWVLIGVKLFWRSNPQTNANITLNPEHSLWLVEVIVRDAQLVLIAVFTMCLQLQVLTLIFPGSDTSSSQRHSELLCGSSFYIGLGKVQHYNIYNHVLTSY